MAAQTPDPDAPSTLVIDVRTGALTLEIVDHDSHVVGYAVEGEPDAQAATLRRLDGAAGPYRVWKEPGRLWRCTCESFRYKKGRFAPYGCKHVHTLRPLYTFALSLTKGVSMSRKASSEAPTTDPDAIAVRLAAPFDTVEVKFKPQAVSGNRALAIPFVDARVIQDRLDDVLGVMGWQDAYEVLPDGAVVCRLKIHLGGEWITKEDVGGQSEQPDEGDRRKAAFSDALKRAAVKFGIGRYLYRQKPQWCDYDPAKRQFVRLPVLTTDPQQEQQAATAAKKTAAKSAPPKGDFYAGLMEYDKTLTDRGLIRAGALVMHVAAEGKRAGFPADLTKWTPDHAAAAREWTKAFVRDLPQPAVA